MDLTLYQGKEINNKYTHEWITHFELKDEARYSMSGKTLRIILDQLHEDSKIPFADIKYESEKVTKNKQS